MFDAELEIHELIKALVEPLKLFVKSRDDGNNNDDEIDALSRDALAKAKELGYD